jgi:DNA repair ATPase RecN
VTQPVAEAVARFLRDPVGEVERRVVEPFTAPKDPAHGKVDKDNRFWVEVRKAHDQLNDAVGWGNWKPERLTGAAERLEAVAGLEPEYEADAREAARLIRSAQANNRRQDASAAHTLVARIEIRLAARG